MKGDFLRGLLSVCSYDGDSLDAGHKFSNSHKNRLVMAEVAVGIKMRCCYFSGIQAPIRDFWSPFVALVVR